MNVPKSLNRWFLTLFAMIAVMVGSEAIAQPESGLEAEVKLLRGSVNRIEVLLGEISDGMRGETLASIYGTTVERISMIEARLMILKNSRLKVRSDLDIIDESLTADDPPVGYSQRGWQERRESMLATEPDLEADLAGVDAEIESLEIELVTLAAQRVKLEKAIADWI